MEYYTFIKHWYLGADSTQKYWCIFIGKKGSDLISLYHGHLNYQIIKRIKDRESINLENFYNRDRDAHYSILYSLAYLKSINV